MKKLTIILPLLLLLGTALGQKKISFCPVKTGTDFCKELELIKEATIQELDRVKDDSSKYAKQLRSNAQPTLEKLTEAIADLSDGVIAQEIPKVLTTLEYVYKNNFLAKVGYYGHPEKKEITA